MSSTVRGVQAAVWAIGVVAGFVCLADYESTAGRGAGSPPSWPAESQLERVANQPTLVLFAHARCPCTRASIGELERLMVHAKHRATVHVVMFDPGSAPGLNSSPDSVGWTDTNLWGSANAIPGVRVSRDPHRREAALFGAATSGQVVFYDANQHLQFCGGITGSRGHAGGNAGSFALIDLLRGRAPATATTPVFGCSLTDSCCDPTVDDRTR